MIQTGCASEEWWKQKESRFTFICCPTNSKQSHFIEILNAILMLFIRNDTILISSPIYWKKNVPILNWRKKSTEMNLVYHCKDMNKTTATATNNCISIDAYICMRIKNARQWKCEQFKINSSKIWPKFLFIFIWNLLAYILDNGLGIESR